MYVCICNAVTEKAIRQAARSGVSNLWDLQSELGVAAGCGSCKDVAMDVIRETLSEGEPARPRLYTPAVAGA